MRKNALFVGNGINLLGTTISWEEMLKDIIRNMKKDENVVSFDNKPYPLLYEEIFARGIKYVDYDEKKIKERIHNSTRTIESNIYHNKLMSLPFENILTTNYDYCLENSFEGLSNNTNHEKKYSLFRKRITGSKNIWHIHGELDHKESLMLGYEHYVGALQKMRNYTTSNISVKGNDHRSPFIRGISNFETEEHYSWVDIFLRDNIHIVGFGLGFDEIDIWWLLSYRNRRILNKKNECGEIFYYHFNKGKTQREKAKHEMLKILGVNIKTIELDRRNGEWQYEDAWDKLLIQLRQV